MNHDPRAHLGKRQTRLTKATINTVGAGVLLIILSASTHDGWLVLLAGFAFGLAVAAFVLRPRLDTLDVVVTVPPRGRVGDPVPATLVVTNSSDRPSPAVTLTLGAAAVDQVQVRVPPLAGRASAVSELSLVARSRGEVRSLDVTTSTSAPFSILTVAQTRNVPVALLVHPLLDQPLALVPAGVGDSATTAVAAPGIDVQGVREWHRGEPTGRLYARGTARRGTPLVLDRHDDAGNGIAIVVGGGSAHPLWEAMVSVVAGTLVDAVSVGRPVAIVTNQPGLADLADGDSVALLDWCARLVDPMPPTVDDVRRAAAAIGNGGTVVLADITWASTDPSRDEFAAAAAAEGASLSVLHPYLDRTDALCLHPHGWAQHDGDPR